ncbi:hypothetical protein GG681_17415 [Epibacterium sp. SM1969]|uniref:PepSY-associated TM helix n=1 Tax=Tritonibacter aquimaris TaxID=2663379 RepID=A0A844ANU3_9RHOB|nr:PepSY-associated TM helix domain-containing protein [Tritonibacter aquimaris]MQY44425.1 hypothetical protein [Tritonibacter aquimaris]
MSGPSNQAIKRMISLHGWSGTLVSIFLYAVILTGTVSVLSDEIARWADPRPAAVNPFSRPIDDTMLRLRNQVPGDFRGHIEIDHARDGSLRMFFYEARRIPKRGTVEYGRDYLLDPETHLLISAKQGEAPNQVVNAPYRELPHFIVDLHARLLIPGRLGLYATGLLGVMLLVAAITGILIHRHILKDLFVAERPGGRVVSLRDRHGLASVWGLPFSILLAFTGTFLSFAVSLGLPIVAVAAFGGDIERAFNAVTQPPKTVDARPAELANIDQVLSQSFAIVGSYPRTIEIEDAGRADARITTLHRNGGINQVRAAMLEFDGVSGALIGERPLVGHKASVGSSTVALMTPLHYGDFAGLASKAVWVALGSALTVSMVSGMQLWLRRREDDPLWRGCQIAFSAVAWGVPLSMVGAAYGAFLYTLDGDTHYGTHVGFFLSSLAVVFWALFAKDAKVLSVQLLKVLSWTMLALPVIRLQTGGISWGEAILDNIWEVLLMDLVCVTIPAILLTRTRLQQRAEIAAQNPAE